MAPFPDVMLRVRFAKLLRKNGHNFATGLPIDVMFGSRVGFSAKLRFLRYGPSYMHCCRALTFASAGLSRTHCKIRFSLFFFIIDFQRQTSRPFHGTSVAYLLS